jgi:hypothetical protein
MKSSAKSFLKKQVGDYAGMELKAKFIPMD